MRKVLLVLAFAGLLVGGWTAPASATHSGCLAVAPGSAGNPGNPCSYTVTGTDGSHNAVGAVTGGWSITCDNGVALSGGAGPIAGTVAVNAAAGVKCTITISGAGVISSGNTEAHP